MSLTWPESYLAIKDTIYSQWEIKGEIEILREFSDGKSKARVFEVDLQGRNHRGIAILKLDTPHRRSDDSKKEADRHACAEHNTPEYAQKHIPKVLDFCEHEAKTALLCSVAGNTLINTQPLLRLHMGQQFAAIQRIASGILEEWNKKYTVSDHACVPYDALISWLGYRIHPDLGGRIQDFLQDKCGLDPSNQSFSFLGEWFLNPFAYVVSRELWPSGHEVKLVKGNSHGDLHGHNILVRIEGPYDYNYYLIDLALYEENSYLFYDHAYLELSHLLHYRGNAQFSRWFQILQVLTGIQSMDIDLTKVEPDDYGLLRILQAARQEILKWVQNHEATRKDHLEGQTILAKVAIGLNFVNKGIGICQWKLDTLLNNLDSKGRVDICFG